MITTDVVVLLFGGASAPRPLVGLDARAVDGPDDIDAAAGDCKRLIVVGTRCRPGLGADPAAANRPSRRRGGPRDRMVGGAPGAPWHRAPGAVDPRRHRPRPRRAPRNGAAKDGEPLRGEAVVDDTQLFDGEVAGVRVEPMQAMPGLRACVIRPGRTRWVIGRAAQLGTTGRGRDARRRPGAENRSPIYVLSPHAGLAAGEIGPCESSSPAATAASASRRQRRWPQRATAC